MKEKTKQLLDLYNAQVLNIKGTAFKHYSQGPADPRPYVEGGEVTPYYDYSDGYSDYTDGIND